MNAAKLNDWLQLIVALAVLAGLVLVIHELRQNNRIASVERFGDLYQTGAQIRQLMYEHETLLLLQKSIERPDDISDAEIARLDSFYELIWLQNAYMVAAGRLGLYDARLEILAPDFAWYCQSRLCRKWIEHNDEWLSMEPQLLEAVRAELDNTPVPTKFQYMIDLKSSP
jgi:hypothetical protein